MTKWNKLLYIQYRTHASAIFICISVTWIVFEYISTGWTVHGFTVGYLEINNVRFMSHKWPRNIIPTFTKMQLKTIICVCVCKGGEVFYIPYLNVLNCLYLPTRCVLIRRPVNKLSGWLQSQQTGLFSHDTLVTLPLPPGQPRWCFFWNPQTRSRG